MTDALKSLLLFALVVGAGTARADFADHFARQTDIPVNKAPSKGTSHVLVLPIEVSGHTAFDMAAVRRYFDTATVDGFTHYFDLVSNGRYHAQVTVADPVHYDTCPLGTAFEPKCEIPRGDGRALAPAIDTLRASLKQLHDRGVRFTDFDANGKLGTADGTIDGFLLLVNVSFGGIALPIGQLNDGDNLNGGTGGPFVLDGVKLPYVAIAGSLPVLLHEFGHELGYTDLYDENQADGKNGGTDLSLMGNWSFVRNPPHLDAESSYRIAWSHTVHVTKSVTLRVKPAEQGGDLLRVGDESEYFLIENRGPGPTAAPAVDQFLGTRGVAIFHVDRAVGPTPAEGGYVARLLNCVNCDHFHPYIQNMPRPGKTFNFLDPASKYEDALFQPGDTLGPDSSGFVLSASHPVASTNHYVSGASSGLTVTVVSRDGDDFLVKVDVPTTECKPDLPCPDGAVCPDEACYADAAPDGGTVSTPQPAKGCGCSSGSELGAAMALALYFLKRASKAARAASSGV